jgi:hypothetical protein
MKESMQYPARMEALGELMHTEGELSFSPAGALGLWLIFKDIRETVAGAANGLQVLARAGR